jgi:uncharacterized membrane protein
MARGKKKTRVSKPRASSKSNKISTDSGDNKKASRETKIRARALKLYHLERESYSPLTVHRMLSESSQAVVVNEQTRKLRQTASGFYSIIGQFNLLTHGVNSINLHHPWLRFHAMQAAAISWAFLSLYILFILYMIMDLLFISTQISQSSIYLFLSVIMVHAFLSILLSLEATRGRQFYILVIGDYARSATADYYN